jgi:hypothetical protein
MEPQQGVGVRTGECPADIAVLHPAVDTRHTPATFAHRALQALTVSRTSPDFGVLLPSVLVLERETPPGRSGLVIGEEWSYLASVDRFALGSVGVPTPASAPSEAGWAGSAGPKGPWPFMCSSS